MMAVYVQYADAEVPRPPSSSSDAPPLPRTSSRTASGRLAIDHRSLSLDKERRRWKERRKRSPRRAESSAATEKEEDGADRV